MTDFVNCHCCKGSGLIKLTGIYAETLRVLRRRCSKPGEFVVANRDYSMFGCNATALNNRLAYLEKNHFAESCRFGRQRRFTATYHGK